MHDRISINPICFRGADFQVLSGYWAEVGIRRVSLWSEHIMAEGRASVMKALQVGHYQVETITHHFLESGHHLEPRQESWHGPRERLMRLIDDGQQFGARSIYVQTGGHGTLTWEEAAQVFSEAISPCVARAKAAGVFLLVEEVAPSRADFHIVHSLRDAVTLAEMADVGICLDIFSCWTEAGLEKSIRDAAPRCALVQISDYVFGDTTVPGRAVPGDGDIPLDRILNWILGAGYSGAFDLELVGPRIDREGHLAATRRALSRVGDMLHSRGV
jgi:sugar phosphate isomerase/epimerase